MYACSQFLFCFFCLTVQWKHKQTIVLLLHFVCVFVCISFAPVIASCRLCASGSLAHASNQKNIKKCSGVPWAGLKIGLATSPAADNHHQPATKSKAQTPTTHTPPTSTKKTKESTLLLVFPPHHTNIPPPSLPLFFSPSSFSCTHYTDMTEAVQAVQAAVAVRRVRVDEHFRDFDPLRAGKITPSQLLRFVRCACRFYVVLVRVRVCLCVCVSLCGCADDG